MKSRDWSSSSSHTVAVAMALAVVGLSVGSTSEEVSREFFYANEPETEILTASYTGPLLYLTTIHLYGDGRLYVKETSHSDVLLNEYTIYLSQDKVETIIRPLVEAGVMEFNYRREQEQLRGEQRVWPVIADSATFHLLLNLEYYRGPGNPDGGPMAHAVAVHALRVAARYNADIPELVALSQTERRLSELCQRARAHAEEHGG